MANDRDFRRPRRTERMKQAPVMLVMGDGESEKAYFERFRGSSPSLRIVPVGTGISGIRAIEKETGSRSGNTESTLPQAISSR